MIKVFIGSYFLTDYNYIFSMNVRINVTDFEQVFVFKMLDVLDEIRNLSS